MSDYLWTKDASVPEPDYAPIQGPPSLETVRSWGEGLGQTLALTLTGYVSECSGEETYHAARLAASRVLDYRYHLEVAESDLTRMREEAEEEEAKREARLEGFRARARAARERLEPKLREKIERAVGWRRYDWQRGEK